MKKNKECSHCGKQLVKGKKMLKALICSRYYCNAECFAKEEGAYYVELEFGEDE